MFKSIIGQLVAGLASAIPAALAALWAHRAHKKAAAIHDVIVKQQGTPPAGK